MKPTRLGDRFEKALALAHRLHRRQTRKSTTIPYISHLLAVAGLVLEDGGSETEAIAALLHDAVEDQGGLATLRLIERDFGHRVAELVEGVTDAHEIPKPPWKKRKVEHLKRLAAASRSVQRIKIADLLHNIRSTLKGFREVGPAVWKRFSVGREEQLWYYRTALATLKSSGSTNLEELKNSIETLNGLAYFGRTLRR